FPAPTISLSLEKQRQPASWPESTWKRLWRRMQRARQGQGQGPDRENGSDDAHGQRHDDGDESDHKMEDAVAAGQSPDSDSSQSRPQSDKPDLERQLFGDDSEDEDNGAGAGAEDSHRAETADDANSIDDGELEGMLSDNGDDNPPNHSPTRPPAAAAPPQQPHVTTELMLAFYQRLFPFNTLHQWLNHGVRPSPDFTNREFALTLQNDAYLRYQSYTTPDHLRRDILRLNPSRFEIGPVYSANPRDRKSLRLGSTFRPIAKELVFDIDVTDYDDIRTCCRGTSICHRCWPFVTMAARVIDAALREDFGFEHIMWVYSGRRGAHAWVCDREARELSDDRRRAVVTYLEVLRHAGQHGSSSSGKRITEKRPLHPHVERSLEILRRYFATTTLVDQDTFRDPAQAENLLRLLPDQTLAAALRKKWAASESESGGATGPSSKERWADIDKVAKKTLAGSGGTSRAAQNEARALREAKQDIVLEYTYPRLDSEVSKKMIHLLKSPFVVHPGTGRVCVPIDMSKVDEFDPFAVPTVARLIEEINEFDLAARQKEDGGHDDGAAEGGPGRRVQDYEKTSLRPYVEYFRSFVADLLKSERGIKRERADDDKDGDGDTAMEF
ncbi:hypothetical protein KEM52_006354, partial [Ascosphaera acerosa]